MWAAAESGRACRTYTTYRTYRTYRSHWVAALLAVCLAGGCAGHRERLPSWEPAPPDETWRALRDQATGDLTATGEVTLWTDRGRATLDCAIASSAAGDFRLRAWKLDQAALDITLTGGELWLHAPQSDFVPLILSRLLEMGSTGGFLAVILHATAAGELWG